MAQQSVGDKVIGDVTEGIKSLIPSPLRKAWNAYSGTVDKVTKKGSSTNAGKLPDAWEEANRKSIEQQLGKPVGKKKVAKPTKRTAPLATKRVGRKRG